jgi:hypothetical protein
MFEKEYYGKDAEVTMTKSELESMLVKMEEYR